MVVIENGVVFVHKAPCPIFSERISDPRPSTIIFFLPSHNPLPFLLFSFFFFIFRLFLPLAMYTKFKAVALLAGLAAVSSAQDLPYQPCPLLRAYYPIPSINKSSAAIQAATATFTKLFDNLVKTGCSDDFGCISPNTTSFSIALYSTADAGDDDDFIFFDYSHTVPSLASNNTVGLDTIFPTGTLTQVFTVYAWLIQIGDGYWEQPISKFLPELATTNRSVDALVVNWDEVSVGSLAGQMSGIVRDCEYFLFCIYGSTTDHMLTATTSSIRLSAG